MADLRKHSSTSNIVRFTLKRADTGQGLTGLTSGTVGLIISTIADNEATTTSYPQTTSKIETITTLGTFAAPTATKCRFKEIDSSNHPGLYEFQFDDARFAVSGAKRLIVSVFGAANLLSADYEIRLTAFDPDDAVGLGLSRVDAAISSRMATFTVPANFSALAITAGGSISNVVLVATTTTNTDMRGTDNALLAANYTAPLDAAGTRTALGLASANLDGQLADLPTVAEFEARTLASASYGTSANQATIVGYIDTEIGSIIASIAALNNLSQADVRTSLGLASANLDGQLADLPTVAEFEARTLASASYGTSANQATIAGYIDTEIGAIIASIAALNNLGLADVRTSLGLASANLDAQLADLPTVAEFNARTLASASYGTSANQATIEGKVDVIDANVDTLLARITATLFAGMTSLAQWLGLISGKQVGDATARTELRATGAGSGAYDETTDSTEAIRDRGDAAWITGGGGGVRQVNVTGRSAIITGGGT